MRAWRTAACLGLPLCLVVALGPRDAAGEAFGSVNGAMPKILAAHCAQDGEATAALAGVPLPSNLTKARESFLEGVCHWRAGRWEQAQAIFRQALAHDPVAPHVFRWYLLNALISGERHGEAVEELTRFLKEAPPRILVVRLRMLLAGLMERKPPLTDAEKGAYLWAYFVGRRTGPEDYDLLAYWHEIAAANGQDRLARKLSLLMWSHPKDGEAVRATAGYPGDRAGLGRGRPPDEGYLYRSAQLFRLGLVETLTQELDPEGLPQLAPEIAQSLGRLYFRAMIRKRDFRRAILQLYTSEVRERFSMSEQQFLVWAIRIQLRRRNIGAVQKLLQRLEEISPKDPALPSIFMDLVRYYAGQNLHVTAMHWVRRLGSEHPREQEASDAYWYAAWRTILAKDYPLAETVIKEAGEKAEFFHPVDQARLVYWKGRLRQFQGDPEGAKAAWKELEEGWPYGYYSAMAEFQSNGKELELVTGHNGAHPYEPEPPAISELWTIAPFPRAAFLFSVGESDLAGQVLARALSSKISPRAVEEASQLFAYLGNHYLQLRLVANHRLDSLRKSPVSDSAIWRRAFPLAHWDMVTENASSLELDPYVVLAVMREESRFFNGADSSAGAKGLMQMMPATARYIAKRNRIDYDEARLTAPEVNISLGALYLKRMLERFKGNLVFAAAGYNAGPRNAARWQRRYGHLPLDEIVERIPYRETQQYVKRVFLSYWVYTKLYR